MPASGAAIGYGIVLEIQPSGGSYTYVSEIFDLTLPSANVEQVEATHTASPDAYREYIPGLTEPGEVSFSMNFVPGSATDTLLKQVRGATATYRVTHRSGRQVIFTGFLTTYETSAETASKMESSVSIKVSGQPTYVDTPAAPRNLVAPSVSGTETVGQVLIADPGVWAGAVSIAYQWQNDGGSGTWADISGATSKSYVLAATDEGDDIRVTVSATNTNSTVDVNSAETGAIAAAS